MCGAVGAPNSTRDGLAAVSASALPRLPLVSTLIVAGAVAVMVALGVWQLGRAEWKGDLIARYTAAAGDASAVPFPRAAGDVETALYRRSSLTCERVLSTRATAGRSDEGVSGWAHIAICMLAGGGQAEVALGWSREPRSPQWRGGQVSGFVAPAGEAARLVAAPAQAGLEQLAQPDPNSLPNNHLAYAGQWFFFAVTALVIYVLALRRRGAGDAR